MPRLQRRKALSRGRFHVLTRGIKDSQAAQEFTYNLVHQAKSLLNPDVDFLAVAEQYQNRIREDEC